MYLYICPGILPVTFFVPATPPLAVRYAASATRSRPAFGGRRTLHHISPAGIPAGAYRQTGAASYGGGLFIHIERNRGVMSTATWRAEPDSNRLPPAVLRVCFLKHLLPISSLSFLVGRGLVPAPSAPTRPWYCPLWNYPVLPGDPVLDHELGRKIYHKVPHPMIQLFPGHSLQMHRIVTFNITHPHDPPGLLPEEPC